MERDTRRTESISSQMKRFACGGWPDDPTEVHPSLMPFWIKEVYAKRQAPAKKEQRPSHLPRKSIHLERYFDRANLTPRQRECVSLLWEYRLSQVETARRMKIHRTGVQDHARLAVRKLSRVPGLKKALQQDSREPRT